MATKDLVKVGLKNLTIWGPTRVLTEEPPAQKRTTSSLDENRNNQPFVGDNTLNTL